MNVAEMRGRAAPDVRGIHNGLGLVVRDVLGRDGRPLESVFFASGAIVRVVAWFAWLRACLFGAYGITVRQSPTPMVLLDWETYCRMAMGLQREEIPCFTDGESDGQ